MSDTDRFVMLLLRTGVSLPRGVVGVALRGYARALATGASTEELDELRRASAKAHWNQLRGAIGAALDRHGPEENDPTLADALGLTLDDDPTNPLALALAEDAARLLAAVHERVEERMIVLDARLSPEAPSGQGDAALIVGAIVVDLLDLAPDDYEDEIAAYLSTGESDTARRELARTTGDIETRQWAREELGKVTSEAARFSSAALTALTAASQPEDPADDAVWVATMLSLVEDAVELAVVSESGDDE